jgi:hypothetical protein
MQKESAMPITKSQYGFAGAIISAVIIAGGAWASVRWDHNHKLQAELEVTKADLLKRTFDLESAQKSILLLRNQHAPTPASGTKKLGPLDGRYEWQWADDGWRGYLMVEKNGAATLDMKQTMNCPDKRKPLSITKQGPSGMIERIADSGSVHIHIPVTFVKYTTDCNAMEDPGPTILDGDLSPYTTYAGTVEYKGPDGKLSRGDMVLVKGWISGIRYSAAAGDLHLVSRSSALERKGAPPLQPKRMGDNQSSAETNTQ